MPDAKLLLDTNVIIDFLNQREPHCADARAVFIAGKVGALSLWMTTTQMTDVIYILSNGGRPSEMERTLSRLRSLRTFIHLCSSTPEDIDATLESSWKDPEDALLMHVASRIEADALLSRDAELASMQGVPVMTCGEFLTWLDEEKGVRYQAFTF